MGHASVRVAVVSRFQLIRAGLTQLLATDPGRVVVVDLADHDGHLGGHDVAVYDLASLVSESHDDLRHLLAAGAPVVALEPPHRRDLSEGALALGVAAVLPLDVSADELLDVLEQAASRRPVVAPDRSERRRAELAARFTLTGRELDILELIAAGIGNQDICGRLYLSINSVKTYIRSAYRKIGVKSRSQAVLWAIDHGLGGRQPRS